MTSLPASDAGNPVDAVAAAIHPDPYPWYAALRDGPSLIRDERLGVWIASRADVVHEVLSHPSMRVRPMAEPVPCAIAATPAGEIFAHLVRMNDGAAHAAHRPPLQAALAGLDRPQTQANALRIARRWSSAGLSDAIFAMPIAGVAHLLGFADDALPAVVAWMRDFVACLSPLSSAARLRAASEAAVALTARFEALVAQPPSRGGSLLAAVTADASGAVSRPMLANLVGLLSQTCDATAGLLGNSLVALAREPALRSQIRARPELLATCVEEVARHDPSVQNTRRFVADACAVAGVELASGDAILLVLGAANRDPSLNPSPERFDLARADRRTLGFGHGAHRCPGHALAHLLAEVGLQALLERDPDLDSLGRRGWQYRPSVNARIPQFH